MFQAKPAGRFHQKKVFSVLCYFYLESYKTLLQQEDFFNKEVNGQSEFLNECRLWNGFIWSKFWGLIGCDKEGSKAEDCEIV